MIGESAGLTLRYVGLAGRFAGKYVRAELMAASTSRAAPSMFRLRSNWMVMLHVPRLLVEVISVTPAMWPNWRSSGVATDDAMISALAPGKLPLTEIVGKSTCGKGETGRTSNAIAPAIAMAIVSSVVATGRWMKGSDTFITIPPVAAQRLFAEPPIFLQRAGRFCRRRCKSPASCKASGLG